MAKSIRYAMSGARPPLKPSPSPTFLPRSGR